MIIPTTTIIDLICFEAEALTEWFKETNCPHPEIVELSASKELTSVIFPDETSLIAFKLRWL